MSVNCISLNGFGIFCLRGPKGNGFEPFWPEIVYVLPPGLKMRIDLPFLHKK